MTDERERDRDSCFPEEGGPSEGMMEGMMSWCAEMMPRMRAMCCGPQNDEEETADESTQEA
jgi:hypothetical protein